MDFLDKNEERNFNKVLWSGSETNLDPEALEEKVNKTMEIASWLPGKEDTAAQLRQKNSLEAFGRDVARHEAIWGEGANDVLSDPNVNIFGEPVPTQVYSTSQKETLMSNPKWVYNQMKKHTWDMARMTSVDFAMGQHINRLIHSSDFKLDPSDATEYARSQGVDLKFNRPVSLFEVDQKVETTKKRSMIQEEMSLLETYGPSRTAGQSIVLGATAMVGGSSAVDLAVSTVGSFIVPFLALKSLSTLAGASNKVLSAINMTGKARMYNAWRAQSRIMNALKYEQGTDLAAGSRIFLKNGMLSEDALKSLASTEARLKSTFEKVQNIDSLNKMTSLEEALGNSLSYLLVDQQFVKTNLANSEETGVDLYTASDAAAETILGFGLSFVLPFAVRKIAKKVGHVSTELSARRLDDLSSDVKKEMALGTISKEEGEAHLKTITKLKEVNEAAYKEMKQVAPELQEAAERLKQTNTNSSTMVTQMMHVYNALYDGRMLKIHDIPNFEGMLSHIDARLLAGFSKGATAEEVFGDAFMKAITNEGMYTSEVTSESGLLGFAKLYGITPQDLEGKHALLYKGMILNDEEARNTLYDWMARRIEFTQEIEHIRNKYVKMFVDNNEAMKAGERSIHDLDELSGIKEELKKSFFKYRFGDDANELLRSIEKSHALHGISDPAAEEAYKEFTSWFDRYVNTEIIEKGNNVQIRYDWLNRTGKAKDKEGVFFNEYIAKMRNSNEEMIQVIAADDALNNMYYSPMQTLETLRALERYDVPEDTNLLRLFNMPRVTTKEMQDINIRNDYWRNQRAIRYAEYKKMASTGNNLTVMADLRRSSKGRGSRVPSQISLDIKFLDDMAAFRKEQGSYFAPVREAFQEKVFTNESLQEAIASSLDEGRIKLSVAPALKEAFTHSLKSLGALDVRDQVGKVAAVLTKALMKQIEDDPNILEALLTAQKIEDRVLTKTPEEMVDLQKKVSRTAAKIEGLNTILDPLIKTLDAELSRLEIQSMNNITVMTETLSTMLQNPANAAEVITGRATNSVKWFKGAHGSVEYEKRSASVYLNDFKNSLLDQDSSEKGRTLHDVWTIINKDLDAREEFIDVYTKVKHGEDIQMNTDNARIAQILLDEDATINSFFRKYGSDFDRSATNLDRSKLEYSDALMPEPEIAQFGGKAQPLTESLDPQEIMDSLPRYGELGDMVRRGDSIVKVNKKLAQDLDEAAQEIISLADGLDRIDSPLYKRLTFLLLRDGDLDKMFDAQGTKRFSLNKLREFIYEKESHDWIGLVDKDLQNLFDAASSAKFLKEKVLGKDFKEGYLSPDCWAISYKSGFSSMAMRAKNAKAAALDDIESGFIFRNAAAEAKWSKALGYNTPEEFILREFTKKMSAITSIEKFGTIPMHTVEDVVNTYNAIIRSPSNRLAKPVHDMAKSHRLDPERRYVITESQFASIRANVEYACGLCNSTPSEAVNWVKSLVRAMTTGLLSAAGFRSLADYGTIANDLVRNGLFKNTEVVSTLGRASIELSKNQKLMDLVLATKDISAEELMRQIYNDPTLNIAEFSKNVKGAKGFRLGMDKFFNWVNDMAINKFGRMTHITNSNRRVAAFCIQAGIGDQAATPYKSLSSELQGFLRKDSIMEDDWEFLRQHAVRNVNKYVSEQLGRPVKGYESLNLFMPQALLDLPDEVFAAELKRRGELNITKTAIADLKERFVRHAWNLVDGGAADAISLPSGRDLNILRFGAPAGSGSATIAEAFTQYMSFGVKSFRSQYDSALSYFADKETGIGVIDLFNKNVLLHQVNRGEVYKSAAMTGISLIMVTLAVNVAIEMMKGNVQAIVNKKGEVQLDELRKATLGSFGLAGTVMDAIISAIGGSGQSSGSFAVQALPSVSNLLRTLYRGKVAGTSEKIPDSARAQAIQAWFVNELARTTGFKVNPLTAWAWQEIIGDYVDMMEKGGRGPYGKFIKRRSERGYWIRPNQRNPQTLIDRLQN